MSLFSKSSKPKVLWAYPNQQADRTNLASAALPGALERLNTAGQSYPGDLVAPLSEFEQTGLEDLDRYLGSTPATETDLYKQAEGEISKTLTGGYDPLGDTYYQAYRNQVLNELQESKDRLAASTSSRDKYFGGGRISTEGELERESLGDLSLMLAQLAQNERQNKLNAVPMAMNLTTYGETAPLARVAASQEYGDLPREIEQAGLSAEYQEYIRQLEDLGIPLDTALSLALMQPTGAYNPQQEQKGWVGDVAGIIDILGGLGGLF